MGILKGEEGSPQLEQRPIILGEACAGKEIRTLTAKYKGRPPQGDAARQEDVGRRARKALAEMNANKK